PYTVGWDSATVPNGVHVLAVTARDAAGNQQTASVSVTVANDTTAPTVTITSPAEGATITDRSAERAVGADNVGVAGVQFMLDGVNVGAQATVAPYEFTWNSSTVTNGAHALAAIARDAAGNQRTASVNVTVANDTTPPTVTLTSPAEAATITE